MARRSRTDDVHNVAVLDQKWWLGVFWLSGNRLLGRRFESCRPDSVTARGLRDSESPFPLAGFNLPLKTGTKRAQNGLNTFPGTRAQGLAWVWLGSELNHPVDGSAMRPHKTRWQTARCLLQRQGSGRSGASTLICQRFRHLPPRVDLPDGTSLFDRAELKSTLEELHLKRVDLIRRRNLKPVIKAIMEAESIAAWTF
jgi:hypothetical protein